MDIWENFITEEEEENTGNGTWRLGWVKYFWLILLDLGLKFEVVRLPYLELHSSQKHLLIQQFTLEQFRNIVKFHIYSHGYMKGGQWI